jgi:hypothetical protein
MCQNWFRPTKSIKSEQQNFRKLLLCAQNNMRHKIYRKDARCHLHIPFAGGEHSDKPHKFNIYKRERDNFLIYFSAYE